MNKLDTTEIAIKKIETRILKEIILKKLSVVKKQHTRILNRLAEIVHNQKHYLKKKEKNKREQYYDLNIRRYMKMLKSFGNTADKVNEFLKRVYIDKDSKNEDKYYIKMSKNKFNRINYMLKHFRKLNSLDGEESKD